MRYLIKIILSVLLCSYSLIADDLPRFDYQIVFKDKIPEFFKDFYLKNSKLSRLQKNAPASYMGVVIRARRDLKILEAIAEKFGYFDATFDYNVEDKPIKVVWDANLGTRYKVNGFIYKIDNPLAQNLQTKINNRIEPLLEPEFDTENIISLHKYIIEVCMQNGFPFVELNEPEIVLDEKEKTVKVVFVLKMGPLSTIAKTNIADIKGVSKEFIFNRLAWSTGDIFDSEKLSDSRKRLLRTGVIGDIEFTPKLMEEDQKKNTATVEINVDGAPTATRAIGAGVKYAIYEGVEGNVFWSNVNLHGMGRRLKANVIASKKKRKFEVTFVEPDFFSPKQELENSAYYLKNKTRAYDVKMWHLSSIVDRELSDQLKLGFGGAYEQARVKQDESVLRGRYFFLPLALKLDLSDNKLNPTRGFRLQGKFEPYVGNLGKSKRMIKLEGQGTIYFPLMEDQYNMDNLVLAGRLRAETIYIKNASDILPIKRLYGGGINSVRAYGSQMVSPLGPYGEPRGGKFLFEWSGEMRFRFNQDWGAVAFVDVGRVSSTLASKTESKNILWGPGVGLRYFTGMGPLSLDVAMPMRRRRVEFRSKKVDAPFQLYISFGQAF